MPCQQPEPYYSTDALAPVFHLDHARREKERLFAGESDVLHERRRTDRMLDGLTWHDVAALVALAVYNVSALVGFCWLLGRFFASLEAGVWL